MAKLFKTALLTSVLLMAVLMPTKVSAVSGSDWQAGRITDDSRFFSAPTMSVIDIQNFLNAKVPVCDTWGTQGPYNGYPTRADYGNAHGNPPPYTCLKDYVTSMPAKAPEPGLCNGITSSGATAADVIYWVAQSCGVNPQVIIVLLQKEQSLVTDDWPWPVQYRSATGYGCPDGAPCDAEYYGLFNQIYNAARQFKRYALYPDQYNFRGGVNAAIQYNPNAGCGSSVVYLQNQATAGLYNYTPYQPNAAALNNLYGTGDGCSAYGNRNYWRLFHDWFGSPYACESPTLPITTLGSYDSNGYFYQRTCHSPGGATNTLQFGNAGWTPLSGDWNHDGVFTPGAYDPNTGRFYLRNSNSSGPADNTIQYGNLGWKPVVGDWDSNGYWSIGLYDPASSIFYLKNFNGAGGADYVANFGNGGWKPIAGDWDRNGSFTIGVYNPNTAIYYLNDQIDGSAAERTFNYGNAGWLPITGDWDGNGYWSIGTYDSATATFYLRNLNSAGSADITVQYGNAGWLPVVGDWDGR